MRAVILGLLGAISLTGCTGPTIVALKNPKTEQVVECKPDPWAVWNVPAEAERCAKTYENAGFVRLR